MSTLMRLALLGSLVCLAGAALLYVIGLAASYFMDNGIIAH